MKTSLQAWRYFNPGSQAAYGVSFLNGHVFKEVQCDNVKNLKMMSRTIISPFSLAYPNFYLGFWADAKHSLIHKNFTPLHLLTGTVILVRGSLIQCQPIKTSLLLSLIYICFLLFSIFTVVAFIKLLLLLLSPLIALLMS